MHPDSVRLALHVVTAIWCCTDSAEPNMVASYLRTHNLKQPYFLVVASRDETSRTDLLLQVLVWHNSHHRYHDSPATLFSGAVHVTQVAQRDGRVPQLQRCFEFKCQAEAFFGRVDLRRAPIDVHHPRSSLAIDQETPFIGSVKVKEFVLENEKRRELPLLYRCACLV